MFQLTFILCRVSKLTSNPVSSLNQQDKSTLITLPNEVKLMIIQKLDIIDSTCLGLASKSFYPLHKAVHGFVPLLAKRLYWVVSRKNEHSPKIRYCKSWYLTTFIKEWMGSRGLELCVDGKKKRYVLAEQHAERWCCVRKKICLRGKRSTLPQDRAYFLELRSKMEMAMVQPRS